MKPRENASLLGPLELNRASATLPRAMFESGTVTLVKIVTTIVVAMSVIPVLFLLWPGADKREPKDVFDTD